jgi:hypothetical protein
MQETYWTSVKVQGGWKAKIAAPPDYEIADFQGLYSNDYGTIALHVSEKHPGAVRLSSKEFERKVMQLRADLMKLSTWNNQ